MPRHDGNANKKRKHTVRADTEHLVDTSRPTAVFRAGRPRDWTLSIAVPSSVIANASNHDAKTALVGSIARACAVFCVDEIVIFQDGESTEDKPVAKRSRLDEDGRGRARSYGKANDHHNGYDDTERYTAFSDPQTFFLRLLSYLETPPHLRKALFPLHPDLRTAGLLPSLDMPHHLRTHEWCRYREGVTLSALSPSDPCPTNGNSAPADSATSSGTFVDAGFASPVSIPQNIPPSTRVTLRFEAIKPPTSFLTQPPPAEAVSPTTPREEGGYYWGYASRMASSLSAVLTEAPYPDGYDVVLGMSERGRALDGVLAEAHAEGPRGPLATFRHVLVCIGGVAGLEHAFRNDPDLGAKLNKVEDLFDYWINLCPGQGSRTIRTEEAVWLSLMGLRPLLTQRDTY